MRDIPVVRRQYNKRATKSRKAVVVCMQAIISPLLDSREIIPFSVSRGSLASQTDVTPAISWRDFVARGRDFIAKSHRTETELLDREKLADTPRHTGDIACAIQLARENLGCDIGLRLIAMERRADAHVTLIRSSSRC